MRRKRIIDQEGPYHVSSCVDGTLVIYPRWTHCGDWDVDEGGGPGIFSRVGLAQCIEELLNKAPADLSPEGYAKREAERHFIQRYGHLNVKPAPHNTLKSLRRQFSHKRDPIRKLKQ